ncbi:MAG: hypothetical protein EPN37_07135 [Chitinophagaceae bacterium]|nr:MAG: hypothetical protein EPN37_07135 [Chitinophagaceae bacterium]
MTQIISIYRDVSTTKTTETIEVQNFLDAIKSGYWQDVVLPIRAERDEEKQKAMKRHAPLVTISGVFNHRRDSDLKKHSGLIAIDIDHLNERLEEYRRNLASDRYCFALFSSIRGNGLCMIFKIDGARHRDAFTAISAYLLQEYDIVVDSACVNESRARFVSYDPYLIQNDEAQIFKKYLPKEKKRKLPPPIVVKNDFDEMVNRMVEQHVNCTDDYRDWLRVCFGIASYFGESGRDYFHRLSSISGKYDSKVCEKIYTRAIRGSGSQNRSSIATIYWFAKQAGIPIYTHRTKQIIRDATSQKKSGITNAGAIAINLQQFGGIAESESLDIIAQVLSNNIAPNESGENLVSDIAAFLVPYQLRRNLITRNIEMRGEPINDQDINSIFLDTKIVYDNATKDLVTSIIFSNRVPSYNPIHEFFKEEADVIRENQPNLQLLLKSIDTDTPNAEKWITKWLVSLVAAAYGKHSPLVLVLAGEIHGKGKTEWFRRLLPDRLKDLYGESRLDAGKDDEILLTKKWIIMDDEFEGKSKQEAKHLKGITSKQVISVREPYGRVHVDLKRLAVLCGTSNDLQILNDPTGNRRIIPVHVNAVNFDLYNSCDKEELLRELYSMYQNGYDYHILGSEVEIFNENTNVFKQSTPEEELILTKLQKGVESDNRSEWLTITQIVQYLIQDTKITRMSNTKVGMLLTKLGFEKIRMKLAGNAVTAYHVICYKPTEQQQYYNQLSHGYKSEELPF